jgi:hypothetical protein
VDAINLSFQLAFQYILDIAVYCDPPFMTTSGYSVLLAVKLMWTDCVTVVRYSVYIILLFLSAVKFCCWASAFTYFKSTSLCRIFRNLSSSIQRRRDRFETTWFVKSLIWCSTDKCVSYDKASDFYSENLPFESRSRYRPARIFLLPLTAARAVLELATVACQKL